MQLSTSPNNRYSEGLASGAEISVFWDPSVLRENTRRECVYIKIDPRNGEVLEEDTSPTTVDYGGLRERPEIGPYQESRPELGSVKEEEVRPELVERTPDKDEHSINPFPPGTRIPDASEFPWPKVPTPSWKKIPHGFA